jgi:hypothetical protein
VICGDLQVVDEAVDDRQTALHWFQRGVAAERHDKRLACADVDIEEHCGSGGGGHAAFARDAEPVRLLLLVEIRAVYEHTAPLREGQICCLLAHTPVAQLVLAHNHPVSLAK